MMRKPGSPRPRKQRSAPSIEQVILNAREHGIELGLAGEYAAGQCRWRRWFRPSVP